MNDSNDIHDINAQDFSGRSAKRRTLGLLPAIAAGAFAGGMSSMLPGSAQAQTQTKTSLRTLRIGFQKYGTLTLLKARGDLCKRLAALGVETR